MVKETNNPIIDVEEISEVIVRLTIPKNITGSFNLGNNDYTTIKNTFESFIESINSKSKIVHVPIWISLSLYLLDKWTLHLVHGIIDLS